ncbi:MAG: penicillin-binding transpeptidase domain-containing protein, partial [Gammaproteobacteria bacterium]
GTLRVGPNTIHDTHDYGLINVSKVIAKSSNVGASKIALSLPAASLWNMFHKVGFGSLIGANYQGETAGNLPDYHRWYPIDHATFSFGYGLSVSTLQLARAYAALAAGGVLKPVSFVPVERTPGGERVMSVKTARQVITMMDGVVSDEGTGELARVPGYHVAGKTGTVRKSIPGGYAEDKYVALFAGMIPATRPSLVMVVMINDPRSAKFYGGSVAAPVFSRVMGEAMRLLDIAPDDLPSLNGAKVARVEVL